ncbi:HD domain-containing phosphohydrolase [Pseudothauera lacus]|nr:HD domain-containing phosphohydrolase [Pseudothauera lacus]
MSSPWLFRLRSRFPALAAVVWRRLLALCLTGCVMAGAHADEVRIGVLALRGVETAERMWVPTADYLQARLPAHRFTIVPLGFDDVQLAVRQRSIDLVLANPSYYVELEALYGISPVVTMRNRHDSSGAGYGVFGGVVFTRAEHAEVRQMGDLRGRRLAAVHPGSFGGWHAGWRELRRRGVDPEHDLAELAFLGTHDEVVYAVLEGRFDAGTVRTETLERMAQEGRIELSRLFVLNERQNPAFPLRHSTALYPEWPLARLGNVPEELAVQVAVALMLMEPDDPAALAGHTTGWTLPLNYQPVHEALRELRIGPYAHLREVSLREVLAQYWYWAAIASLLLLLAFVTVAYIGRSNRRLRQHQGELQVLNASLEERVVERTQRVGLLLDRERFLRGIVEMVADVNEILITASSRDEMLKACCDRLVANPDYRFCWVALLADGELVPAAKSYGTADFVRAMSACQGDGPGALALRENRTVTVNELAKVDGLAALGIHAVTSLPLRKDAFAAPFGTLCVFTARGSGFDREEVLMLEQLAGDIGFATAAFDQREETARLQRDRITHYEKTILSLVDLIERRDTYTAGHTRRVAHYCGLIAAELGLEAAQSEELQQAARLHDIGKIAIPDAVLLKPGPLTALEYELIKQHVVVGYETLMHIDMYAALAEILRHHHERHDGSGYPAGLAGEAIPLAARIMAVADAFDAMTTNRIYRPRKSVAVALEEIGTLAGSHYHPEVAAAARRALQTVEPPPVVDQLPRTALERQRFAYFFNDQLTGVHNASYLQFIFRNKQYGDLQVAAVCLLHDFGAYNLAHGWVAGNRLLADVAAALVEASGDALVCRVMGDDFVILAASAAAFEGLETRLGEGVLAGSGVRLEVERMSVDEAAIARLQGLL